MAKRISTTETIAGDYPQATTQQQIYKEDISPELVRQTKEHWFFKNELNKLDEVYTYCRKQNDNSPPLASLLLSLVRSSLRDASLYGITDQQIIAWYIGNRYEVTLPKCTAIQPPGRVTVEQLSKQAEQAEQAERPTATKLTKEEMNQRKRERTKKQKEKRAAERAARRSQAAQLANVPTTAPEPKEPVIDILKILREAERQWDPPQVLAKTVANTLFSSLTKHYKMYWGLEIKEDLATTDIINSLCSPECDLNGMILDNDGLKYHPIGMVRAIITAVLTTPNLILRAVKTFEKNLIDLANKLQESICNKEHAAKYETITSLSPKTIEILEISKRRYPGTDGDRHVLKVISESARNMTKSLFGLTKWQWQALKRQLLENPLPDQDINTIITELCSEECDSNKIARENLFPTPPVQIVHILITKALNICADLTKHEHLNSSNITIFWNNLVRLANTRQKHPHH